MTTATSTELLDLPASTPELRCERLAYIEGRDGVLHGSYAFLAHKETESSGAWRVRIRGHQTSGAVFEPAAMRQQALLCEDMGKSFFPWGFSIEPSAGDPREVQFRVHVADGQPREIEMYLRLRKGDGSPAEPKSVRFAWPA